MAAPRRGFVILAAPGMGKKWFVRHHAGWHDADDLMAAAGLHTEEWHATTHTEEEQRIHYQRCDAYTEQLRADGHWIVSSLFWKLVPDAIVLIDEDLHYLRVAQRPDLDWASVQVFVKHLRAHAARHHVPVYRSLEAAVKANKENLVDRPAAMPEWHV